MVMRCVILYFFIVLPAICYGQSGAIYFDKDWKKSEQKDAEYIRTYEMGTDNKYKVEDRYINGNKLQMSGYYSSLDSDGIRDGHFVYYSDGGFVIKEGNYEHDIKAGEWKYYYANSKNIKRIEHSKNGIFSGESTSYYENGKIKDKEVYDEKTNSTIYIQYDEAGKEITHTSYTEVMPKPPYNLNSYIAKNMKYPRKARKNNITGRVDVKFTVDIDGKITNTSVLKHIDPQLDAEALRIISEMPPWNPGTQNGVPVKVYFTQPIIFNLQ